MTQTLNRWLSSLTLACWGTIMLYFYLSGRLAAYLHPAFRPGVLVCGLVLLVFAIGSAFGGDAACCREGDPCGRAHAVTRSFTPRRALAFAILLLPMVMAFSTSRNGFGLDTISNRGVVMDASGIAAPRPTAAPPYVEAPLPTNNSTPAPNPNASTADQYVPRTPSGAIAVSVIDLLYATQDPSLRADFEGKVVELIGQLMDDKKEDLGDNRLKVVRMFMTCCAADAKPVAVLIELPPGMKKSVAPELSWVTVNGTPTFPTEGGHTIAVLKVKLLKVTNPPEETMLGF